MPCHLRAQHMINSHQYKHHREKTTIEFHSPSHFTLTTTQLNPSLYKNFKLFQNDSDTARIFLQPPLISFKHDKKHRPVRVTFQSKVHSKQVIGKQAGIF